MIELFRKYCEIVGELEKFGRILLDNKGVKYCETLSGKKIYHLAYKGEDYKVSESTYYKIGYAVCSGVESDCFIGKPNTDCVKNGTYIKNKCAVVFMYNLDLEVFNYSINYDQLLTLLNAANK